LISYTALISSSDVWLGVAKEGERWEGKKKREDEKEGKEEGSLLN